MTRTEATRSERPCRGEGRAAAVAAAATLALAAAACSLPGAGPGGGPGGTARPEESEAREGIPDPVVEAVSPALDPRYTRRLPPIPRDSTGPLRPRVVYPDSLRLVGRHDSTFVFGTVGTGDARLEVNGTPVPVEPNGAFLAWLPVPEADWRPSEAEPDTAETDELEPLFPDEEQAPRTYPDSLGPVAHYTLVATREDGSVDTLWHPVRRPRPDPEPPEGAAAWIDSTSVGGAPARWALSEEEVEVSARAAPDADVWLESRSQRFPLRGAPGSDRYRARIKAWRLAEADAASAGDTLLFDVVAAAGGDTARREHPLPLRVLDPEALPTATLEEPADTVNGEAGVVIGRTHPFGTYYWRFPEGTRVTVSGRLGPRYRVRLAPDLTTWVAEEDVRLSTGRSAPRTRVDRIEVRPMDDRLRLTTRLDAPVPLRVEQPGPRTLTLTLYGATGSTSRLSYGPSDPLLESVDWRQEPRSVVRVEVRLARRVWGYRVDYRVQRGGSARLALDVRRPPEIDGGSPLEGRRIAVDPGHPGAGATGPTGYYEGDANLAVARRLSEMLEEAGAEPILIRNDTLPMGLYERTRRAREEGAELFVSIHNNALPDGVRPFREHGTGTYYFHPHARELARHVQRGMLESMGLRDLGIFYGNLAVAREPWMPSVLAEGAFMMIPRHEAALKTPVFQRRYAEGVLRGIRAFLRERAR